MRQSRHRALAGLLLLPLCAARSAEGGYSAGPTARRLLLPAGTAADAATAPAAVAPRLRFTIDAGWRYAPEPDSTATTRPGASPARAGAAFDDSGWEPVALPHTWNASDAFGEAQGYRRGAGWYRKRLRLPREARGRRVFLYFEGANQTADVFVNGRRVGRHVGGYTAFAFEITDALRADGDDVLAVRVDNAPDPDVPPLSADFTFYGGIYRDVWLIATGPVHVDVLDHASPGVFIDTPEVSDSAAALRVRGAVVNEADAARTVDVVHRVVGPEGDDIAVLRTRLSIPARGRSAFEAHGRLPSPRLWTPGTPSLYRLVTEVRDGPAVLDRVETAFGVRSVTVDPRRGLLLNGRSYALHGANRHQDEAGHGNALSDAAQRRDIRLVKRTGFDFLRLAHYPQDPAVLDEADHVGLALWEEVPVVNRITQDSAFAANAERMLTEMIRQHYNHPAVFFWGYMNEVLLREPRPLPAGYIGDVVTLARRLDARAHAEDPWRPTAMAVTMDMADGESGIQDVADVLGLNLYFGWYYRDADSVGAWIDSLHARRPRRPLAVSEYGAGSDDRVHTVSPERFDFSAEYQQRLHETTFRQLAARPWLVATAMWNEFDFGSNTRDDTRPNLNQKGLLSFDRTPKDVWWYYRAKLDTAPVLRIASRSWARRAGSRPADRRQPLTVYSNLDSVELFVDGHSLGVRAPLNATVRWTVPLHGGRNRIEAVSHARGRAVRDALTLRYDDRTALFSATPPTDGELAVNVGSEAQFVDAQGVVWEADRAYRAGSWGCGDGKATSSHTRIAGTSAEPLFQTSRAARECRFDVADGEYDVELLFAETSASEPGERVFDVRVNDAPVFTALDLAREYGRAVAVRRRVVVTARDGQGVRVRLDPLAGATTLSGIRLRRR